MQTPYPLGTPTPYPLGGTPTPYPLGSPTPYPLDGSNGGDSGTTFDPTNQGDWSNLLENQTDSSGDPNWKKNIDQYNSITGLPVGGRYQGYNAAKMLLPAEYWNLANQQGFYNSMQGDQHAAVYQVLNHLMHPELMAQDNANAELGNLPAANQTNTAALLSAGAGQGTKEGVVLHNENQANRNIASFNANIYSPQGQMDRARGIANVVDASRPNLGNLSTLHSIELGTPRNQSGLDVAGQLFGEAAGSGAFAKGGAFGK